MIKQITAILVLISMFFGAYLFIDGRYALSATVNKIEKRLEQKILSDQLNNIQERIWKLEDRYYNKAMPQDVKEEYRKLLEEKGMFRQDLKEGDN